LPAPRVAPALLFSPLRGFHPHGLARDSPRPPSAAPAPQTAPPPAPAPPVQLPVVIARCRALRRSVAPLGNANLPIGRPSPHLPSPYEKPRHCPDPQTASTAHPPPLALAPAAHRAKPPLPSPPTNRPSHSGETHNHPETPPYALPRSRATRA